MEDKELTGQKMIAFRFKGAPGYTGGMKKLEGQIGRIVRKSDTYCAVNFRGIGSWNYPYPEILEHLVEKQVVEKELTLEEIFDKIKNLTP
jgi:hypothetical protein